MSDDKQPTQPKKGDPVQIPVPSREQWLRDMRKVAPPARQFQSDEGDDEGSNRSDQGAD